MDAPEMDTFWDDCPLVGRDPEIVHGAPVVKNERGKLTRLPADVLTGSVESFMERNGMTEDEAIAATLKQHSSTPGGADTIRKLLAYQEAHLHQPQP